MAVPKVHEVVIDKLVHGGQGLGTLPNGKKALVWNVLPGEKVRFTQRKKKSSYVEGVAKEILVASDEREAPRDELYLSTSPWQMMTYQAENKYKKEILVETLERAGVEYAGKTDFYAPEDPWHYRNKMEYSFYGDEDGLHLALFSRGTHRKQIMSGSSIARVELDRTAGEICRILNDKGVRASDLKSVIVRCDQAGQTVAALFTRTEKFPKITELQEACQGIAVYFSTPKSPASVITKELYILGNITLQDKLLELEINYDVTSFFQVNLDPYEEALRAIKQEAGSSTRLVDMYAGAGSIGLSVSKDPILVEADPRSVEMARINAESSPNTRVIEAASEKAVEYIPSGEDTAVVFDPPRAGLHKKVTEAVLEKLPGKIIYLSCNPSTFARDLALLRESYTVKTLSGYNFFPKTPHIEALAVLMKS